MRDETVHLPLSDIVLPDVRTGALVALADLPGVVVLTLVRHRY